MSVTSQNIVRKFPHYRRGKSVVSVVPLADKFSSLEKQDELVDYIFAPDPVTGVPRSDLAYIMSKDAAPEVSQFIRDTLLRPNPSAPTTEDSDLALDSVKNRGESVEAYASRLRELTNFQAE